MTCRQAANCRCRCPASKQGLFRVRTLAYVVSTKKYSFCRLHTCSRSWIQIESFGPLHFLRCYPFRDLYYFPWTRPSIVHSLFALNHNHVPDLKCYPWTLLVNAGVFYVFRRSYFGDRYCCPSTLLLIFLASYAVFLHYMHHRQKVALRFQIHVLVPRGRLDSYHTATTSPNKYIQLTQLQPCSAEGNSVVPRLPSLCRYYHCC
mmetsp:Transcript_33696/g.74208  ORF Transcript_33696/g.74208 Transcript_33696/m.74208 type:complete len:204 (-) Transcript_33696:684-1295(-)